MMSLRNVLDSLTLMTWDCLVLFVLMNRHPFMFEDFFDGLVLDSAFATSGQERYDQLMQWLGDAAPQAEPWLTSCLCIPSHGKALNAKEMMFQEPLKRLLKGRRVPGAVEDAEILSAKGLCHGGATHFGQ